MKLIVVIVVSIFSEKFFQLNCEKVRENRKVTKRFNYTRVNVINVKVIKCWFPCFHLEANSILSQRALIVSGFVSGVYLLFAYRVTLRGRLLHVHCRHTRAVFKDTRSEYTHLGSTMRASYLRKLDLSTCRIDPHLLMCFDIFETRATTNSFCSIIRFMYDKYSCSKMKYIIAHFRDI